MKKPVSFVFSLIAVAAVCRGTVIRVPGDQPTIQAGINVAVAGDTILVADGTYTGDGNRDIDYLGKAITVISENGPETCVIDSYEEEEFHRGFHFHQGEAGTSILSGLTIKNGTLDGGGIFCIYSSPRIENCILEDNNALFKGGGILCQKASPEVAYCIIHGNSSQGGGGIHCEVDSSPLISNCTIRENTAPYGGGIFCYSSPHIVNCAISANTSEYAGAGIYCYSGSAAHIANCLIQDNSITGTHGEGGCIFCDFGSRPIIDSCTIQNNYNGGIRCVSCSPSLTNLLITSNTHPSIVGNCGGGLYLRDTSAYVMNLIISSNSACLGGGIALFDVDTRQIISNCSIVANHSFGAGTFGDAGGWGGGIFLENSSAIIANCDIAWNSADDLGWDGDSGGGVYAVDSDATFYNCLIRNNQAMGDDGSGGGLYLMRSNCTIINCTIAENMASEFGGGVHGDDYPFSILNSIFRGNDPYEIFGNAEVSYCDVQEGYTGAGNIDADPLFASGPDGDYYLSHLATGHSADSPCIDAGSVPAADLCFDVPWGELCFDELSTRIDEITDTGIVDMGVHYFPAAFATPTPVVTPTPIPTSTPTSTPSNAPYPTYSPYPSYTPYPTYSPYPTPEPTDTPVCSKMGCTIEMPSHLYHSGDPCFCRIHVCNTSPDILFENPVFVILDVYGEMYFAPGFTEYDYYLESIPPGLLILQVVGEFTWPEGAGSASGIFWYAALTDPEVTAIFGEWDSWEFGWSS